MNHPQSTQITTIKGGWIEFISKCTKFPTWASLWLVICQWQPAYPSQVKNLKSFSTKKWRDGGRDVEERRWHHSLWYWILEGILSLDVFKEKVIFNKNWAVLLFLLRQRPQNAVCWKWWFCGSPISANSSKGDEEHPSQSAHLQPDQSAPSAPSARGADGACLSTKWRLEAEVRRLDFGEDTSALAQQAEVKHKNKDKQKIEGKI